MTPNFECFEQRKFHSTKNFDLVLKVIQLNKHYLEKNEYILSKQLARRGTSIGVYVEAASAVQSQSPQFESGSCVKHF
ncbi:MAG: four helix bundle protein [Bacteroidetes bacterium]|nr:four helix bundle protein [Bacteroidota bacterium]